MARTAITLNTLTRNTQLEATTTNVDTTNNHVLTADDAEKVLLVITNTTGSDKTCTVVAGDSPPAVRKGIGDLTFTVTNTETRYLMIETARFLQSDGTINIDLQAGYTGGTITAIALP